MLKIAMSNIRGGRLTVHTGDIMDIMIPVSINCWQKKC